MNRLARHPTLLGWLTIVWVALWGNLTFANVAGGLLAGGALIVLLPGRSDRAGGAGSGVHLRPLPALRFLGWFAWKLAEANAVVAWEVLTPRNRINEGIVAVPLVPVSDALTTLVCNAVSLTPGTLVIDVDPDPLVIYVHVLHLRGVEEVRADVRTLARLATAAFGSAGERDCQDDPPDVGESLAPSATTRTAVGQDDR